MRALVLAASVEAARMAHRAGHSSPLFHFTFFWQSRELVTPGGERRKEMKTVAQLKGDVTLNPLLIVRG